MNRFDPMLNKQSSIKLSSSNCPRNLTLITTNFSGSILRSYIVFLVASVCLHGCAVTSRSIEGTSETVANTAEASIKVSSSTSPRSGESSDSPKSKEGISEEARKQAEEFIAANHRKVLSDMARGQGEYLSSLAHIFGMSRDARPIFEQHAQHIFETKPSLHSADASTLVMLLMPNS